MSFLNAIPADMDELDEALNALADCVAKATEAGHDEDDWITAYVLPVGPIHRAIPLLNRHGIVVRPGFDGRHDHDR